MRVAGSSATAGRGRPSLLFRRSPGSGSCQTSSCCRSAGTCGTPCSRVSYAAAHHRARPAHRRRHRERLPDGETGRTSTSCPRATRLSPTNSPRPATPSLRIAAPKSSSSQHSCRTIPKLRRQRGSRGAGAPMSLTGCPSRSPTSYAQCRTSSIPHSVSCRPDRPEIQCRGRGGNDELRESVRGGAGEHPPGGCRREC